MSNMDCYQECLEPIIWEMVGSSDYRFNEIEVDDDVRLITLAVKDAHLARVIGKNGEVVKALETIVKVLNGKYQQRAILKIVSY